VIVTAPGLAASQRREIPAGGYKPLFGAGTDRLDVKTFWIDEVAVTNTDFLKFVKKNKNWLKKNADKNLVDSNYVSHWRSKNKSFSPQHADAMRPLTYVSWFAANDYCVAKGGRLPTTLEWEYVAAASANKRDASGDQKFQEKVLLWYTTKTADYAADTKQEANYYGLKGLHGQIWEWTSDFNAFFVTADNRQDGDQSKNFFCGGAATNASNRENYPAFMRYALRSSLQANYSLNNLGFRCAYDQAI
jgi:formylglycine-generating enzyme required for sulfatase activity